MLSNFRLDAGVPVVQDMKDVGIEAESTDPKELGIMLPIEWCRNLQTPSVQSSYVLNFSFGVHWEWWKEDKPLSFKPPLTTKCSSLAEFWNAPCYKKLPQCVCGIRKETHMECTTIIWQVPDLPTEAITLLTHRGDNQRQGNLVRPISVQTLSKLLNESDFPLKVRKVNTS